MFVTLTRDPDGYPPWEEEEIWALRAGADTFRLDASPTFVRGLSYRDVVHVVAVGERWYADSVSEAAGHSKMRVVLFDDAAHDRVIEAGRSVGCDVDHTEITGLFAIDVPPSRRLQDLLDLLDQGCDDGVWDYEEGNVSEIHSREVGR